MVASTSEFMVAAMTDRITKPSTHAHPDDHIIPMGTALAACNASSLIWMHESKNPIDQIGARNARMKHQPVGQVVWFSTLPNTQDPEFNRSPLVTLPTGSAITVATMRATLMKMEKFWILGMMRPAKTVQNPCTMTRPA